MANQPSEAALLAEYSEANRAVLANAQRSWQAVSIFSAISLAGLAVMARELVARDLEDHTWHLFFAVLAVGVIACVLVGAWWLAYRRQRWLGEVLHFRMREIEAELQLRRNIYVHVLDRWQQRACLEEWKALAAEVQTTITTLRSDYGRALGVGDAMLLMIVVAPVGWAGLLLWEGLTVAGVGR